MSFQSAKAKSAAKIALPRSERVSQIALNTLRKTAEMVGSTLGPFGQQVLIERSEVGMKPFQTKDGVTVHKEMGFSGSIEQVVLEAARDAAVRTAQEAGDGTTTATILSYSIAKQTHDLSARNRKCPPQKIVREINNLVPLIESEIAKLSRKVAGKDYKDTLVKVATLSANGDVEMAKVIMEAFDLVGDQGNITVTEEYGLPSYEVKKVDGFTIEKGFEESCEKYYSMFINDPSNSSVYLKKPAYLLFDGQLLDIAKISNVFAEIDVFNSQAKPDERVENVVLFAHSFSQTCLQQLAYNFRQEGTLKVFPMLTTQSAILNSRTQFLHDIAAFTGAKVFNPMINPMEAAKYEELITGRSDGFEAGRYRSTIIGNPDPTSVEFRVDELKQLIKKSEARLDQLVIEDRIGKLTCGIARVKIIGPSQSEIREKKDRAEDAWCSVRSAIRNGVLPGGGWTLIRLSSLLHEKAEADRANKNESASMAARILSAAFLEPVNVLYTNAGYNENEILEQVLRLGEDSSRTFNIQEDTWCDAFDILDSAPAVLEAIRNSISIASLLGTLGGIIVFKRDSAADTSDSRDMIEYTKALADGEATSSAEMDFDRDA